LQRGELLLGDQLGVLVARDIDVDDATRVNVWREENGRKLNLRYDVSWLSGTIGKRSDPTRRLSSVRRTATPASTLPTVSETNMLADRCLVCICDDKFTSREL
jgi:hypothetical protein